jgi:hypothetical protein
MLFHKDLWIVTVATLSLIASIIIPFVSRRYDQDKAKISFDLYLKKYLGVVFNILTYDKIGYHEPSIKDEPKKLLVPLFDYIELFIKDFKEHQSTLQPRVGFHILLNLQYLMLTMHRVKIAIQEAGIDKLYEQTLSHGRNLSKKELNKIYAVLLLMEHFGSILTFHDRFSKMEVIKRTMKDGIWIGLQLDGEILKNQQKIAEDLKHLCNEEVSVLEVIKISQLMIQEFKSFYNYNKLKSKKEQD